MVDINLWSEGEDYRCNIEIRGEIPQQSVITLTECDLVAEREDLLVESFAEGQSVKIGIFDKEPNSDKNLFNTKLKKVGGERLASLSVNFGIFDTDVRINHLLVDDSVRGQGLGETLFLIYMAIAELEGAESIGFWIGGGEETKEWLVKMGVPREDIEIPNNSVSFTTQLSKINYDKSRVSVVRE